MPIGTIIGWLIGQLFIGIMLVRSNSAPVIDNNLAMLRSVVRAVGLSFIWTAIVALIGTAIELLVR